MKITEEILSPEIHDIINRYISEELRDQSLFFDIETTGLSPKNASIYLIGTAAQENGSWVLRQWFAETLADEEDILKSFLEYAASFKNLIHFNGTTFDLPFVQARSKKYGLSAGLTEMNQLDIYRRISPFKNVLKLSNCKQKTLEEFLGIFREDPFNGGQLIELYKAYRQEPDIRLLKVLLLHNADDIRGMLSILPVLSYPELTNSGIRNVTVSEMNDREIILQFDFVKPVAKEFSLHKNSCYFSAGKESASVKLPVCSGELKYFYPDYKNYSYLPAEDHAIHKSVAVYVDKAHRVPATPETCYTRKRGSFIPCFCEQTKIPVFHKYAPCRNKNSASKNKTSDSGEFNDFLLLEDSLLQDVEAFTSYVNAVVRYLLK